VRKAGACPNSSMNNSHFSVLGNYHPSHLINVAQACGISMGDNEFVGFVMVFD
jgi:hypothetical protein